MRKLLAVIVMALLLCSVLSTNLFAVNTGPSMIGLSGITAAGYLLSGEVGNAEVKYDTNLPLGEITKNIKPAPSPDGKAKVVEVEIVEEIIDVDISDIDFSDIDIEALLAEYALLADYDAESSVIAPVSEWTISEEAIVVELAAGEVIIIADIDGVVGILYNTSGDIVEVELGSGLPYTTYVIADVEDEANEFAAIQIAFDAYFALSDYYIDLEFDGDLTFSVLISLPDDLEDISFDFVLPVIIA